MFGCAAQHYVRAVECGFGAAVGVGVQNMAINGFHDACKIYTLYIRARDHINHTTPHYV